MVVYQILMISSLYVVFKLCDWMIEGIDSWRVRKNILSNPIQRYEYYKKVYTPRRIKKLKRMPYKDYLRTEHWELARKAVLTRDQYKCADCGKSKYEKSLEVHHITYIRRGKENLGDLMTLCRECHQERHFVATAFE